MKKFSVITLLLLAAALVLVACDGALPSMDSGAGQSEEEAQPYPVDEAGETQADTGGVEKTIYVGPEMVECEGEGPQQCLLVKEDPNGEYMLHYFPIQGFIFEPGYEYELIVREETVDNPPAGGSSITWSLVEEVSRTPVDSAVDDGSDTTSGRIVTAFVGHS